MYQFVIILVTGLILWALFALFTQDTESTKKKPGERRSARGSSLIQMFFVIMAGLLIVWALASSDY